MKYWVNKYSVSIVLFTGSLSPGAVVPYMDSRSTSSGTSDMSDYFETLSLSSYSSSDTHDSLQ